MKIAGIVKCSFIDYPNRMAAVFFTCGCNWDCRYCHNRVLLGRHESVPRFDIETAFALLDKRCGLLDAVVITGGEPTLQPDLADLIQCLKAKGYLVKLDTNGSSPSTLAALTDHRLLDYVAMDIKAPPEKYDAICGVPVDQGAIEKSIAVLMDGHIDYEFRTTIIPQLSREDILAIGHRIHGARMYVLQRYRELREEESSGRPQWSFGRHAPSWLEDVRHHLTQKVKACRTRGFELTPARTDQLR